MGSDRLLALSLKILVGTMTGTAELVALGCTRLGSCEKGDGCPFGITTTDPELSQQMDDPQRWGGCSPADRIVNLYRGWLAQLAGILRALGMGGIGELRGRSDLLVYLE